MNETELQIVRRVRYALLHSGDPYLADLHTLNSAQLLRLNELLKERDDESTND